MLQRFTSILFGDALEEATECPADVGFNRNEDDEDWILVDYLAEACSSACDEELIGVCSENMDAPDCPLRCNSCSSLDSAADTDPEDRGFLHLDAECGLEESWFITPPPCFTAGGRGPVLLETSPLENLLIEHPSMSVYAVHSSDHRQLKENSCEPSILRSFPVPSGWMVNVGGQPFSGLSRDVQLGLGQVSGWASQEWSQSCSEATPLLF
ncbi:tumor protein p53-inducible nuclear protein 1 isoform X2 [Tachysurus fulvidraco]|uniref:tumor protein p53-inducible nuclear protein 1 isoform X2 n=1 Tax=Tachysurus fulvidraco TaxID=1234273 RepID=UPI000F4FF83C|nr:tumor protein p53-inducible nuclear protein 1 isoform X2 [Tachysurus fulvidraco]